MAARRVRKNATLMEVFSGNELINPVVTSSLSNISQSTFDELNTLVGGEKIRTHRAGDCMGYWCCIHNQSPHHMMKWKQSFDSVDKVMLRVCEHGLEHIDPDDPNEHVFVSGHAVVCDGCCKPDGHIKRRVQ
jgi:hypothetical protein